MKINFSQFTEFEKKVFKITQRIPKGQVATYGQIARIMGNKYYARAVGNALNKNAYPITIPCHRVIKSNGEIGGFASGSEKKIELLKMENIPIKDNLINLSKYLVSDEVLES
ncbi:MAG: methylated-DNA--[protein]-cysteine S-methyltransferase [Candidatus Lokiarchaeota archaeon]|nr:methylated-DNA--[protein]-cysteine S-methyltransferase [Candidatus Lokiarchaeota archaeon]